MGQISILGKEGDTRLMWDKTKPDEVEAARKMFNELKAKGYLAFSVVEKAVGSKGEQLTQFDPAAEKIIMAAAMQGGSVQELPLAQSEGTRLLASREFRWCRARLLHALAGAAEQGVLHNVIDELMSVPVPVNKTEPDDVTSGTLIAVWLTESMGQLGWLDEDKQHVEAGGR